jgi:prepilin-type processing-associated H-X9-DG protein
MTNPWVAGGNDYAGCAGSGKAFKDDDPNNRQTYWLTPTQLQSTVVTTTNLSPFAQHPYNVGVFGVNSRTTIADITDGTSNVILAGERRMFTNSIANAVSSANQRRSSDGWAFGGPATMFTTRTAPQPPGPLNGYYFEEAGSEHPQGFNVLTADGSVHWISLNVDLRTWNNTGNMSQGSPVDIFR